MIGKIVVALVLVLIDASFSNTIRGFIPMLPSK
jgi:hypothetical protein